MFKKAVYPGSFDPLTNGHLDIVKRAVKMFDQVIIAVATNLDKNPLFTKEERKILIKEAVKDIEKVQVDSFDGLLVDYLKKIKANVVIRGLRAITDFEYELQMAIMNRKLYPQIETIFMIPDYKFSFLSSRLVKEIACYGGCITNLVPPNIEIALKEKFKKR